MNGILRAKKRRKFLLETQQNTRKWNISVKVGGVSTRSTLFQQLNGNNEELLTALLPAFVQTGRCVSVDVAIASCGEKIANVKSFLASHGVTEEYKAGNRAKRVYTGRTRLIWIKKTTNNHDDGYCLFTNKSINQSMDNSYSSGGSSSNRVVYTSLLNGQRLDSNVSKRPREVKVRVKLNISDPSQDHHSFEISFSGGNYKKSPHSSNTICSLRRKTLVELLLRDAKTHFKKTYSMSSASDATSIKYNPPKLRCISLVDGPMRVITFTPGNLQRASPLNIHLALNQVALKNRLCTVCWTNTNQKETVQECTDCGLLVHLNCCQDHGHFFTIICPESKREIIKWRCAVCNHYFSQNLDALSQKQNNKPLRRTRLPSRFADVDSLGNSSSFFTKEGESKERSSLEYRKQQQQRQEKWEKLISRKCILCPHSGGAMSPVCKTNQNEWVHEICRIWSSNFKTTDKINKFDNFCAICGAEGTNIKSHEHHDSNDNLKKLFQSGQETNIQQNNIKSSQLIKCAANGCNVYFHPFCAMLVNKLKQKNRN